MNAFSANGTTVTRGQKLIAHCDNSDLAFEITELLNAKHRKTSAATIRKLNAELGALIAPTYFPVKPIAEICELIDLNGFNSEELSRANLPGDSGSLAVDVGNGAYLTISWYRMGISGRWEIVAYFS